MRFVRSLSLAFIVVAIALNANAQESLLDFFRNFGSEKEEPIISSEPPDEISSYFGNKDADLPVLEGTVSDIAGAWTITTERDSERCSLTGTAQISMMPEGGYTCELVMRDYCFDWHDGIVRQSCKVSFADERIVIDATILEALNGATLSGYSPDGFVLEHGPDGTLQGNHEDEWGYPALWRRTIDGIS